MQSEILLAKFYHLLIITQLCLVDIPINIDTITMKISIESVKFLKHFVFFTCAVVGPQFFMILLVLAAMRTIIVLPRSSPDFPNLTEAIFFCFYVCVIAMIIIMVKIVCRSQEEVAENINCALRIIIQYRYKGKFYNYNKNKNVK